MAMNFTNHVRAKAHAENSAENTEAGQRASPQRASDIVLRSISERKPVLPLLGNPAANQRNATVPGSPGNRTVGEVGKELSNASRPNLPMSTKLVRKIDRLASDDNDKSRRSLLRLHGNDALHSDDPLAALNVEWIVTVDEQVAPDELSRATPPPACALPVAEPSPSMPLEAAPQQQKKSPMTAAEAFFHYPGPGGENLQHAQWLQSHPLHRMFRRVYPLYDAMGSLQQRIDTPVHIVLQGGIRDPMSFYHSLMEICEQTDSDLKKFETLYRNAVEVSNNADGMLREQADFFSRFFSALIALKTGPGQAEQTRIIETLRQEWLETDFSMLLGHPEASPPQAHWQAAEPARTQVSGRRTFACAMGSGDMSPRKKQKTVHPQEAATTASNERPASRQTPDSPAPASPRASDSDSDTELSPTSERYVRSTRSRSLSWKTSMLKRQPGLTGSEFNAALDKASIKGISASRSPAQQSSAQQAGNQAPSGTTMTPAEPHGRPLSN